VLIFLTANIGILARDIGIGIWSCVDDNAII